MKSDDAAEKITVASISQSGGFINISNGEIECTGKADIDGNLTMSGGQFDINGELELSATTTEAITDGTITVGSTSLAFAQFSGAGQITAGDGLTKSGNQLDVNDDNITLEIASDAVRIKGITSTAVGDLLVGQAGNAGYTRLVKPSGNATAHDYILSMNTSGAAQWSNTLDGGTF